MEKIIESIFLNFDGKTPKEKRELNERKCCVRKAVNEELRKIFEAQSNKLEVHNGNF